MKNKRIMEHKEPWTYFNDPMSERFGIRDADGNIVKMNQENLKHIAKCVNAFAMIDREDGHEIPKPVLRH